MPCCSRVGIGRISPLKGAFTTPAVIRIEDPEERTFELKGSDPLYMAAVSPAVSFFKLLRDQCIYFSFLCTPRSLFEFFENSANYSPRLDSCGLEATRFKREL